MPLVNKTFSDIITFSRASNATMFDSSGTLVYAPNNLLTYSEEFDDAAWTPVALNTTGTPPWVNVAVAPDGNTTADKIIEDSANSSHWVYRSPSFTSGTSYTASVFAKAAERTQVHVQLGGTSAFGDLTWAIFDLSTQTVVASNNSPTTSISAVGNGWFRLTVSKTATATGSPQLQIGLASGGTAIYTGDGTSGLYIWGAQLNIENMQGGVTGSLSTYYPTTSAAYYGPRLDYNPATLAARGLLIEEQRTNTATYSTEFQNAVYLVGPVGDDVTITDNAVTSPDGTSNAATYIEGTASTSHSRFQRVSGLTADGVYTISLFVKYNSGSRGFALGFGSGTGTASFNSIDRCTARWDTLAAGPATATPNNGTIAVISTNAVDVGNGWFRLSMAFTFDTTNVNTSFAFGFGITSSSLAIGSTGDGSSYSIYGFQLEAGAFPTSYIPTTTTALTRSADVAAVNTLSPWFNATSGTLYAEFSIPAATASRSQATFGDGTSNERMIISNNTSLTGTAWRIVDGGVDQADISNSTSFANNAIVKVAGAYAVNDFATCQGGGTVGTDTSGTLPTVTALYLGSNGVSQYASSYLRRITYYPRRLSDAELQAITA